MHRYYENNNYNNLTSLARHDEKSIHSDVYKRLRLFQDRAKNIFPDASNFW